MADRRGGKPGGRALKVRVKTARRRKASSTRWLARQLNDPYVAAARRAGYRSRAAFKLAELDDRFHILKPGARVVDLGAAPGGWTRLAVERTRAAAGAERVLAVDLQKMEPIAGARVLELDLAAPGAAEAVRAALEGPVDVVLSDMAAPATGHKRTDHLRVVHLCELAYDLAEGILAPGGSFVAKVLQGGAEAALLGRLKRAFRTVRHVKPPASRAESAETYLVALGFRGPARDESEA